MYICSYKCPFHTCFTAVWLRYGSPSSRLFMQGIIMMDWILFLCSQTAMYCCKYADKEVGMPSLSCYPAKLLSLTWHMYECWFRIVVEQVVSSRPVRCGGHSLTSLCGVHFKSGLFLGFFCSHVTMSCHPYPSWFPVNVRCWSSPTSHWSHKCTMYRIVVVSSGWFL